MGRRLWSRSAGATSLLLLSAMNRRLRKKKRVGEFKELGFELRGDLRPALAGAELELDAFVDRLIDVVEKRKLAFGGSARLDGFVTRMGRGSATEDDRAALAAFLEGDAAVVRHEVGALRDAWYQPSEEGGLGEL